MDHDDVTENTIVLSSSEITPHSRLAGTFDSLSSTIASPLTESCDPAAPNINAFSLELHAPTVVALTRAPRLGLHVSTAKSERGTRTALL